MKEFRRKCRKHNQLVNFGIDPEYKRFEDRLVDTKKEATIK